MLSQINSQLSEEGFEHLTPILIDADENKVKNAKEDHKKIEGLAASILKIPLEDNSLDAGVSRFALQYLPPPEIKDRPNQADALQEIYRVLKSGSTFVLVYPALLSVKADDLRASKYLNGIWQSISWHRTFNDEENPDLKNRSFTIGEEIEKIAQQIGFKLKKGEQEDWIDFRFSLDSIEDRFGKIESERKKLIEEIFNPTSIFYQVLERSGLASQSNDKAYVRLPITKLVLEKE
jgi:SAM-dependent methyltransferase